MQVAVSTSNPLTTRADLLVFGVVQGAQDKAALWGALDKALGGALKATAKDTDFTGKRGQTLVLRTLGKTAAKTIAVFGLGEAKELSAAAWLELGAAATRVGNESGATQALVAMEAPDARQVGWVARGAHLGGYRFELYRKAPRKASLAKLVIASASGKALPAGAQQQIARESVVAQAVCAARDLINESPLQLYPETFAARAREMARKVGLKCRVIEPAELKKMGMGLLLGVGAGSTRPPRLVHLSYVPRGVRGRASKPIVLVGKGITFDSGGLSLKDPTNMMDMKTDMSGAAAVFATLQALAKLKGKTPVHGILSLAENMPSGSAIRPGDVLTSAAGKTIEVNNTDAEGRLVLADALHYAAKLKPRCMIDLATLTGACVVALGPHTAGVFSNDDDLAQRILDSAKRAGEDFWRLPLTQKLREQLKSDVADMKNTGERYGGAITAALFLKEFVGDIPWAHLDIAGPANSHKDAGILAKGGSGVGVATLVELIET